MRTGITAVLFALAGRTGPEPEAVEAVLQEEGAPLLQRVGDAGLGHVPCRRGTLLYGVHTTTEWRVHIECR